MTIPNWLVQLGSLAGLFTFCFTFIDRLLSGRPFPTIRKTGWSMRDVHLKNLSSGDVWVRKISTFPSWCRVARDSSVDGIARAAAGQSFAVVLRPEAEIGFPIVFRRGELADKDNTEWAPFVVCVSWRKSSWAWLPQFPLLIFSSAAFMRRLNDATTAEPVEN
jgi:hypothetical protein